VDEGRDELAAVLGIPHAVAYAIDELKFLTQYNIEPVVASFLVASSWVMPWYAFTALPLLAKPVRVLAGERLDERRLAVVDVSCGADGEWHALTLPPWA